VKEFCKSVNILPKLWARIKRPVFDSRGSFSPFLSMQCTVCAFLSFFTHALSLLLMHVTIVLNFVLLSRLGYYFNKHLHTYLH